jgi:hypothetical protein
MATIIIAVVVIVLSIITIKAYVEGTYHADSTIASKARWMVYILGCEDTRILTNRGINILMCILCSMFTTLAIVMLDIGITVANVMQHNNTEVHGMGWILVWSYVLGTVGCMAYAVGCGAHVMNRADSHVVILPPAPASKCHVL